MEVEDNFFTAVGAHIRAQRRLAAYVRNHGVGPTANFALYETLEQKALAAGDQLQRAMRTLRATTILGVSLD